MQAVAPKKPEMREVYAQMLFNHFKFESTADKDDCRRTPENTLIYILSVMLRDFPEFLCENHIEFIGAMSPHSIQMRNIISCAFPCNMHMPDPLTPGLKVDMLPEIQQRPQITPIYGKIIESMPFKQDLDSFLEIGTPETVISNVMCSILSNNLNCRFNVPLINAVVLYVGIKAIDYIKSKDLTPSVGTIAKSRHGRFFLKLLELDGMGHQLILTAMCNQLTYPNSHTHYFSCLLQYLFSSIFGFKAHKEIASVILERLAFHPHPWGVLITTVELMKNPLFELFTRDFIRSSPVIEAALKPMAQEYEMLKITPDMYKVKPDASKSKATTDEPEKAEKGPNEPYAAEKEPK